MTTLTTVQVDRDALVERIFDATIGTLELFGVYLGERLGLYRLLADRGALTAEELASACGIDPRYAVEWLEQQAVAGLLTVTGAGTGRRFLLPAPHRDVLADDESTSYLAPFALMLAGIAQALPEVVDAYRSGGGVPWERFGADGRDGQAAINRPVFQAEIADWIAAMPDVRARLQEPGARIADVACGAGWSTVALARAFPAARVDGTDLDERSIEDATGHAEAAGVADRVRFAVRDAVDGPGRESYDLVCILEALHDVAQPVAVLRAARRSLAPGGAVLVVDEGVAEEFTAPGDAVERMMYGWSITCCLPAGRSEQPSAATGTVMRPSVLRSYAEQAGYAGVTVLDVDDDLFRLYRLDP